MRYLVFVFMLFSVSLFGQSKGIIEVPAGALFSLDQYDVYQASVSTTDATVTTLRTIPIVDNRTYYIRSYVTAARTGGSAGTDDDGGVYQIQWMVTTKAGTVTGTNLSNGNASAEDESSYSASLGVSGSNVVVQVAGVANTNINWRTTTTVEYASQ